LGYHSEWNMGSPGGWDYQRMAQEIGKLAWDRIKKNCDIDIDLDFDDPILNPVPNFAQLILRAHKKNFPGQNPRICIVAEKETLDKVGENIRFVEYLNSLPNVKAWLIDPTELELRNGKVYIGNDRITAIFLDFNNNVIVKLKKKYNLDALLTAIKQELVTNPRGMEPIGVKGVFEAVTLQYKDILSDTTVERTPWTRQFYPRRTTGSNGEDIPDLVEWVKVNWANIILKPIHGYSGHGIIIGYKEDDKEHAIQNVLTSGDYIVQAFIPTELWTEEFPWIDREEGKLFIKRWQTDFRCFITDVGLIGFVTRFGGIPTNVGSGGGVQSAAILRSNIPLSESVKIINEAILGLDFDFIWELQQELDKKSVDMGNVYLLGPIMNTLRPRIITQAHIDYLKQYAQNLWKDALTLEKLYLEGKLAKFVQISPEEEEIARFASWKGNAALIASDGLFGFR
ncbi:MAG: hypothetical protein KJ952_06970, partial [Candidatus Omnitrophica bacterium]|nr:hypothetical protein [Candidatus Omnitrophota bacterium]